MHALSSTLRIQFGPTFGFAQAIDLVPYWSVLGISHLYASPVFAARPGSLHGYDVVDHGLISPELGGEEGLRALAQRLQAAGMGLILDIVPNHMGVGGHDNSRWLGLLEFGEAGPDARWFDVDWGRGALVLPILGETLAETIKEGTLAAGWDAHRGQIVLRYHEHQLPLGPATVARLLRQAGENIGKNVSFVSLADDWAALGTGKPDRHKIAAERQRLREVMADEEACHQVLGCLGQLLNDPDEEMTVQRQLLDEQSWRLAHWRTARDELNYRRFFSISDLAAVRVEDPEVFDEIHALPLRLLREGVIDGLRVDHVDGLADPEAYCWQLRDAAEPNASIHIEKILARDEPLRPWPVDGTTGYETLGLINGLFIDPEGYARLASNAEALGLAPGHDQLPQRVSAAKGDILRHSFVTELGQLTKLAKSVADRSLQTADFTEEAIRRALRDLVITFPVYRAYLTGAPADPADQALVEQAIAAIVPAPDDWQQAVLNFIRALLTEPSPDEETIAFRRRFQQLTAPLMAKGYEDTELYRYVVLLSANEVGGSVAEPAVTLDRFHDAAAYQAQEWPNALVPLATHDTKWGADTRARLNLLSEYAEEWCAATAEWSALNSRLISVRDGQQIPSALDEMRIYQILFGAWPVSGDRLEAYLIKAIREAQEHGSWENPDAEYEEACVAFARHLAEGPGGEQFRRNFQAFLQPLIVAGRLNSLAQTIVQLTFPGVPDIYWGNALWDYSLVDPDNRRPVDWEAHRRSVATLPPLSSALAFDALEDDTLGVTKLALTQRLLSLRRRLPMLFNKGAYRRLEMRDQAGARADGWLCFAKEAEGIVLIVIVPVRGRAPTVSNDERSGVIAIPEPWVGFIARDILSSISYPLPDRLPSIDALAANPMAVIVAAKEAIDT